MFVSVTCKFNPKLLSTGHKIASRYNLLKTAQFHNKVLSSIYVKRNALNNLSTQQTRVESTANESTAYRMGRLAGYLQTNVKRYMAQGMAVKNLYECCAHDVEYIDFFKTCDMPDTFQSWFYVLHLHIWMVLVRLKPEGKHGTNLSYYLVELMWKDLMERIKLMGVEDTSHKKETMAEYGQQFLGLIVAYDEGLLGRDSVLASALWRNLFYTKENTDPERLGLMVCYVRKQIQFLEQQDSETILLTGKLKWLPLHDNAEKVDMPDPG